ncbi:MAG: phosphatidate cytidylyltransferase [Elusimicrobiota bacterium]
MSQPHSNLALRVITALVILPVVLTLIWAPTLRPGFAVLVAFIAMTSIHEFLNLLRVRSIPTHEPTAQLGALAHVLLLHQFEPEGAGLVMFLAVTVVVTDTAAYFTGKAIGRHPLAPIVSPKKTWEGAAAGFAAAIGVCLAFQKFKLYESVTPLQAVMIGVIIGTMGQLSDLAESMVKRDVGAKDSGALLPGHGGVFDRFDSYILCAPAVYYALSFR